MSNPGFGNISFDLPKNQSNVIKVIGVGGGGSNAINHMFKQGIKGVDFIVCNTDSQALENSPVPNKIQLGITLTEGMGAGANPNVGQQSAIESIDEIEKMLSQNTKMVFITAGMGGGTGTGAAPVIAQLARERDILTVGIVTIPFNFEGKVRQEQALLGVEKLRKHVDSLIIINNNKLREVYGNLGFTAGFSKADEVLAKASRGIAEVITHHYTQNIDLRDAKTVLANSGTAIMGSSKAEGENRAREAIIAALDSPLLNDNKIAGAKNVLLLIVSGTNEITLDEIAEINHYIQDEAGNNANIIMGVGNDETLDDAIAVTIIATGFNIEQQNEIVNSEPKKIIHTLEDEQKSIHNFNNTVAVTPFDINTGVRNTNSDKSTSSELLDEKSNHFLSERKMNESELIEISEFIKDINVSFEIISPMRESHFATYPDLETPPFQKVEMEQQENLYSIKSVNRFESPNMSTNDRIVFDLADELSQIEVVEPIQFVPVTELSNDGVIRHSLEEYMEEEVLVVKPVEPVKEVVPEELNIFLKKEDLSESTSQRLEVNSPMEMTIDEAIRLRAEERRRKLKEFNYKFHNNVSRIEEYEREPAYKRLGIDISDTKINNANSRISVGLDSNSDLKLRSNNSFLHDNVD